MNNFMLFKQLALSLLVLIFIGCEADQSLSESTFKTTNESNIAYGAATAKYSTVQSPIKPAVNRTNYYPNTNDAAGINEAIDRANSAGGGTVKLESRTYVLNQSITLKSNVRLLGDGSNNTILRRGPNYQTTTSSYLVGADNSSVSDVEIRSIKIEGDYSRAELTEEPTVLVGIRFNSSIGNYNTRIRVIFCEIEGCTVGIQMNGTTHITVQSCDVHDNGGTYLHHNIYFRRIGHVLFYNNNIYNSVGGSGLKLAGGTTNISNESRYFTIRGNKIYNNERINLNIQGCHHLLIENNELNNQYSTVSRMAGMFLISYNGYECRYTDIINNVITDNTNNGVYVQGCRDFNVQGNSCNSNGTNYNITDSSSFSCDYNE